jgi:hypothetical protein
MSAHLAHDAERMVAVLPLVERAIATLRAELDALSKSLHAARMAAGELAPPPEVPWSRERLNMLAELGGTMGMANLHGALNALPGPVLTLKSVQLRWWRLKREKGIVRRHAAMGEAWTPERLALLQRRPAGTALEMVRAELNALPGPAVSAGAVRHKMNRLGLRTPTRRRVPPPVAPVETTLNALSSEAAVVETPTADVAEAKQPPASVPLAPAPHPFDRPLQAFERPRAIPRMPAAVPAPPPKAIVADLDQIRGWLQRKGLTIDPSDLDRVNSYCLRIGAPRFILGERVTAARAAEWGRKAGLGDDPPLFAINMKRRTLGMAIFITPAQQETLA